MANLHFDENSIYAGAQAMNDLPRAHMAAAKKYVDSDTELGMTALGIVGIPAISTYNGMRHEMQGNIKSGLDTIQKLADGLATVAKNYGKANAASTIQAGAQAIPYSPVKPVGSDVGTPEGWAMAVPGGPMLLIRALAIYVGLSSCSAVDKLCLISLGMWRLFKPDDDNLNKVAEAWVQIEKQLGATKTTVETITKNQLGPTRWKTEGADNSKASFENFMSLTFFSELDETKSRAATTHEKLRGMKEDLNLVQSVFFVYVMACLAALITAFIASFYPPLKPAAEAAKKAVATLLSIGTAGALAAILALAASKLSDIGSMWFGREQAFQPNRINEDGLTTNFSDVNRMKWTWTGGQVRQP
ncbi:hypothetical protein [Actinomadura litoris]|uniref:hypothetical protein n=1 Tax=Actinomadura litoris TaxID=2678616 RepID=UPI001FA7A71C|nr:hypothetical protein [Actinomadura litoris]